MQWRKHFPKQQSVYISVLEIDRYTVRLKTGWIGWNGDTGSEPGTDVLCSGFSVAAADRHYYVLVADPFNCFRSRHECLPSRRNLLFWNSSHLLQRTASTSQRIILPL